MSTKRPFVGQTQNNFASKYGAGKSTSRSKISLSDSSSSSRRSRKHPMPTSPNRKSYLTSATVIISIGPEPRLFAAHEHILCASPFFSACCRVQCSETRRKRIELPEEQPEIFACVLEYLYKGDYYPKLLHDESRNTYELEDAGAGKDGQTSEAVIFHHKAGATILRDTAVYCAAEKYGVGELKRLALRKQGLHSGVQCSTILSSARYAYDNTPDTDSKLRAHYLALIIRSRAVFKRSGTMQMEMEKGCALFFDLFVAMCNYIDDLGAAALSQNMAI